MRDRATYAATTIVGLDQVGPVPRVGKVDKRRGILNFNGQNLSIGRADVVEVQKISIDRQVADVNACTGHIGSEEF